MIQEYMLQLLLTYTFHSAAYVGKKMELLMLIYLCDTLETQKNLLALLFWVPLLPVC